MACSVEVMVGPSRSGKTTQLADRYAERLARQMADGTFGAGLWLAPNRYAVERIGQLLLKKLPAGCLAPQVLTFERFADLVLRLAAVPVRPLSRHGGRHLLRHVVRRLAAEGQLPYLQSLADSRGLCDALASQIREWKRLEIWPEDFAAACERPSARHGESPRATSPKDAELARIYRRYQDILQTHHLYDAEGRFWSARTLLREGHHQPIESVQFVVVDGFTDFLPPQHEMLEVLAEVADEMWITLPMDDAPQGDVRRPLRADLFSKPLATLHELKKRHRRLTVHAAVAESEDSEIVNALDRIFRPPAAGCPRPDEVGSRRAFEPGKTASGRHSRPYRRPIAICEMTSPLQEIRWIARDIKSNCRSGQAQPEDVLVVYRSLHAVAPLVEEAFAEYGVPFYIENRRPLEQAPFVCNLLLLLQLDHGDWQYEDLLAVIRNRRIRWSQLAGVDDRAVRTAAERLVRVLQIPSGRQALCRQLERLAASGRESRRTRGAADVARAFARLGELLDGLPREATAAEWAAEIPRLFELCAAAEPASDDRSPPTGGVTVVDQRACERVARALHQVQRLEEQVHGRAPAMERSELLEVLTDIACHECLPQQGETAGRVRVLSAISARGASAECVYFAGLEERAMPADTAAQGYYCEREIQRLTEAGLPLVSAMRRYEEEMLLFYEVASLARQRLVLSYPALDEKAQPMLPSPFVAELRRVGGEIEEHRALELRPVDRNTAPLCPREYRTRAICDAIVDGGDADRLRRLTADRAYGDVARAVVDGLNIVAERAEREAFGPAEGIFNGEAVLDELAAMYGPDEPWSATALEDYAQCPFRFLMKRVIELDPLEDLELSTDHARRGSLVHQCLLELYRRIAESTERMDADFLAREIASFVETVRARLAGGGFFQALEALDLEQVAQLAEMLDEQQKCYEGGCQPLDSSPLPAHFEVRFGPPRGDVKKADEDPLSTDEPFVLDLGGEKILLTGRVDRIDVAFVGKRKVFNIIDYKSGAPKSWKPGDEQSGLGLQIPLYAMAVEELLLAREGAVALQADYWWLRKHGFGNAGPTSRNKPFALRHVQNGELVESDEWRDLKAGLLERVRQIVRDIRDGKFAVYSQDQNCTRTCPYDGTCRVGHVRSLEKEWPLNRPDVV